MMKYLTISILGVLYLSANPVLGQEDATRNEPSRGSVAPDLVTPRVPGQARNAEERDAWQIVEQTPEPTEKAQLAERFLENYPDSGLTPNAHYVIARNALRSGNIEKFVKHAETSLQEIPQIPDLLAELAFVYAERGGIEQAILLANQAIGALNTMEKPRGVSAVDWVSQTYQLKGEAYYALGRAHLNKMGEGKGEQADSDLRRASDYLEQALDLNPQHDYAAFRLGFARRNLNDAEGTVMAYARAVAIDGVAAMSARRDLEQVLGILEKAMPDSKWVGMSAEDTVALARTEIEEDMAINQQEKAQLIQEIQARETITQQAPPSLRPQGIPPSEGSGTESQPPRR